MGVQEKLERLQQGKLNKLSITVLATTWSLVWSFGKILVPYLFAIWVFLAIFDRIGFEKTLIILLIGVLNYGIRNTMQHNKEAAKWKKEAKK